MDSDSVATDSLNIGEIDVQMEVDEDGNPVIRHTAPKEPVDALPIDMETHETGNGEATEQKTEQKKKKAQPEYEDVYF
jgi:hypothetical protein